MERDGGITTQASWLQTQVRECVTREYDDLDSNNKKAEL